MEKLSAKAERSKADYDYVVIGVGGIGSAALYWLTRLAPSARILGIEQFELGHLRGGSQDFSRAVRKAYETTEMSEFAQHLFEPWHELEQEVGMKLFHQCGGLTWTTEDTGNIETIHRWKHAVEKAGNHRPELVENEELTRRWPQLTFRGRAAGIFDPDTGILDAAMCNAAHQQSAIRRGAVVVQRARVTKITRVKSSGCQTIRKLLIETSAGAFLCNRVIVCAGAWVNDVIRHCNGARLPVKVTQENVTYFATPHLKDMNKSRFPVSFYLDKSAGYYMIPVHNHPGFKIGIDAGGNETSGDTRTFEPDPQRLEIVQQFLQKRIPKLQNAWSLAQIRCSSGENKSETFCLAGQVVHLPDQATARFSDVKRFAALLGKILAQLTVSGSTDYKIHPFRWDRPAITDPNFEPHFLTQDTEMNWDRKSKL